MADDPDLLDVRRVLQGDVEAFEGIVRRWQRPLVNLAFRLCRDRGLAEDMAQEAFVKAYRGLARWRGEGVFSTWLFALTLNHCRSRLRRFRPPMVDIDEAPEVAVPADGEREVDEGQRAGIVRRAVADLPEIYRDAVALFYLRGESLEAAANSLQVPEGTLKARLHRARAMLRGRLAFLSPLAEGGVMRRDDVERLLAAEEMIEPSPGFATSVMGAVRCEAEAVAPIAFPWRRALPGLVLSAAGLVAGLWLLAGAFIAEPAAEMAVVWAIPVWLGSGRLLPAAALAGSLCVAWLAVHLSGVARDTAL